MNNENKPRRSNWTVAEVGVLNRRYKRDSAKTLARRLGRTPSAVESKIVRLGLRKQPQFSANEIQAIRDEYQNGAALLANKLGRSVYSVQSKASRLGVTNAAR